MWTYLAILFSFAVIFVIFVRRYVLLEKAKKLAALPGEDLPDEDEDLPEKKRVSREERSKIEEFFEDSQALLKKGKDDEAIKKFVQILAMDSHHEETLNSLAILYLQKQMYGAAASLLRQLAVQTNEAVHYSHLGLALFQQAEYEQALEAYQTAVSLDPSRPQRFASLAAVYKAMDQLNHAVMALNKAIELDQQNLDLLFLLADLQIQLEALGDARGILNKILEMDPKNKEAKEYLKRIADSEKQGG